MILLASCCYAGAKYYNLYILTGKYGIGGEEEQKKEKRKKKLWKVQVNEWTFWILDYVVLKK